MRAFWAVLCLVSLAYQQQCSRNETCFADVSTCGFKYIVRPDIERNSSAVEVLLGRVPHKITVADTSGIHLSVKTAAKYHEERLALLLLTWLQTVQPHQVLQCCIRSSLDGRTLQQVHIVTDDVPQDRWTATAEKYGMTPAVEQSQPVMCCVHGSTRLQDTCGN